MFPIEKVDNSAHEVFHFPVRSLVPMKRIDNSAHNANERLHAHLVNLGVFGTNTSTTTSTAIVVVVVAVVVVVIIIRQINFGISLGSILDFVIS